MKRWLLLFFIVAISNFSWSQQASNKYPTVQNLISNSDNCINIIVVGNGNLIDVSSVTKRLESLFLKLVKNDKRKEDQMLKKLDSILARMQYLERSSEIAKAQYDATQYLDTLSKKYLIADSLESFQSQIRSIYTQTSSLPCDDNLKIIQVGGTNYYLSSERDISKEELIIYETINKNNRLLFKYKQKFGFLDSTWRIIIEPKYDTAYYFSDSLAYVKINHIGEYFINTNDSVIIDLSDRNFVYVNSFYDNVALVKIQDDPENLFQPRFNYIDKQGRFISKDNFFDAADFSYGLASVGNFVFIDDTTNYKLTHEFITNVLGSKVRENVKSSKDLPISSLVSQYSQALGYYKNLQSSASSERYWFKRQCSKRVPKTFMELLEFSLSLNDKYYREYNSQLMFLKNNYSDVKFFHTHRLLYGYIDNKGVFQIPQKFYWAEPFEYPNTARASVTNSNENRILTGLIQRDGEWKGRRIFNSTVSQWEVFEIPVNWFDGKYAFTNHTAIDTSGQMLFYIDSLSIVSIENGLVKCKNEKSQFGLLTVYGVEIFPCKFSTIHIRENDLSEGVLVEVDSELYLITRYGKPIRLQAIPTIKTANPLK